MLYRWLLLIASLVILVGVSSQNPIVRQKVSEYTGMVTVKIPLSGTGSMYPTFPKGKGQTPQELSEEVVAIVDMYAYPSGFKLNDSGYLYHQIERGDIIEFQNAKTDEIEQKEFGKASGFVKRVIGLSGETFEIRDGQVLINGKILTEPYTALPRSTFGGQFLPDCTKLTIPPQKYFVMGDNRKGSGDSRHDIGLIDDSDIHYVLPNKQQIGNWDTNFRNTSNDNKPTAKIKMDKQRYLQLVNEKRVAAGQKPLKYSQKLEKSAFLRGGVMIKFNDFSSEATRSGYKLEKAIAEAGYWNPLMGERVTQGYYEAEELIESTFEQSKTKDFLLNSQYQEIGISEVEGDLNGCPSQFIVQHLGGYVPPNYKKSEVEYVQSGLNKLKEVQPGWQGLSTKEGYEEFYARNKIDVDRLNEIISLRIKHLEVIVGKMEANQWLNDEDERSIKQDQTLREEQQELAKKLNESN